MNLRQKPATGSVDEWKALKSLHKFYNWNKEIHYGEVKGMVPAQLLHEVVKPTHRCSKKLFNELAEL